MSVDPASTGGTGDLAAHGLRVEAARSLRGSLRMPSDKSIAHRALIFDAMGSGSAVVTLDRPGQDVLSTVGALAALGATRLAPGPHASSPPRSTAGPRGAAAMAPHEQGVVRVEVSGGGTSSAASLPGDGGETLGCGNSGTTMRLLCGALAGRPRSATLVGDTSLSRRPMRRVAGPLGEMGAHIETTEGHAPLRVRGARGLRAMEHDLPVASAQVLGAITLAGLAAEGATVVRTPGPTRDHTERLLGWLGVPVEREGWRTSLRGPAGFESRSLSVPGDISSAAAWLVAAAIHPDAEITLLGVGLNPSRLGVVEALREMGADIELQPSPLEGADDPEPVGDIHVRGGRRLRAIGLSGPRVADLIDELPLLGVAMAAAEGSSEVRDAAELRVKESDRVALMARNLAAIGADVEELPDGWRVRPGRPRPARIETAGDHRVAISFAVAALTGVAGDVVIDDPDCVAVSYAGFWDDMARLVP